MPKKAMPNFPEESAPKAGADRAVSRTDRAVSRDDASEGASEADQEADLEAVENLDPKRARIRDRNIDLLLKAFHQHLTRKSHDENAPGSPKIHIRRTDH